MSALFINYQSLEGFAENATSNGILTFILGTLFVLSIYHFLLYFQHKDRSYLYYSLYTILIFLAYISKVETGFLKAFTSNYNFSGDYSDFYRWTYNCMYFIFATEFLELRKINRKWYNYIIIPIAVIFGLAVIAQLIVMFFDNYSFYNLYSDYYLILITAHTIFSFWFIFKLKGSLKYYIIIGAIVLFITSVIGEYSIRTLPFIDISRETGDFYFYFGVFIENICFSLGLGHKQKFIIEERDEASKKLIDKLYENEFLKEQVNKELQEKIDALNNQIEFKQEIADLKLKALRSQMNPHFIFNSLNSIKLYIINNEKENAVYYLNKFAKLIRKILTASIEKEISLEEEIETSQLYLNIENIRFSNEIEFTTHFDPNINLKIIRVPSLILQPFLENALWHGLSSKKGKKKIEISVIGKNENYVTISITDNGVGRAVSKKINSKKIINQKSVGIDITKERLSNFYKSFPDNYRLKIIDLKDENNSNIGTQVIIDIPLNKISLAG